MTVVRPRAALSVIAILAGLALVPTACGTADRGQYEEVEVEVPTEGVVTTLRETEPGQWRIADEVAVADTSGSAVVAEGLDGSVDTFGLAELRGYDAPAPGDTTAATRYRRRSGFGSVLLYGLIGRQLFGGRSAGLRPQPSAYVDRRTFDRVQSSTGERLRGTSRRTTVRRPSSGRSGYGAGRSTRGFGG